MPRSTFPAVAVSLPRSQRVSELRVRLVCQVVLVGMLERLQLTRSVAPLVLPLADEAVHNR